MLALLGNPRPKQDYTAECKPVANLSLRRLVVTESVGPFRVTGLKPAVDSLSAVMAEIKKEFPSIYPKIGSMGMLCCRYVRGGASISNHSWGTAVDLTIDGILDRRGDGKTLEDLVRIAPAFEASGWYWGRHFAVEDSMHFEVSDETIRRWFLEGRFKARRAMA